MTAARSRALGLLRDRRTIGAVAAVVLFLGSWAALGHSFYAHGRISDTGFYQGYGLQMRLGAVPYRDFEVDYPPGSLPVFLAPTYVGHPTDPSSYDRWFARLMEVCGLAALGLVMLARAPARGIVFVAVSPLLVGPLVLTRFDLWPVMLVAAGIAALVRDRHPLGWLALALGFAAKFFPIVLLPIAAVWTLRRRGRRELVRCLGVWASAAAAVIVPFAAVGPHGLWRSVWDQVSRPIQIESLAASLLTTFGHPQAVVAQHSVGIVGHGRLAALTTIVELTALAALWVGFARGPADEERLVRYTAACLCAFVAFGKVLSPQYLIWLVPLVALVRGRRGLAAIALLAAAAVETQIWFTSQRYGLYIEHFRYAALVLIRNLLLVGLFALLAMPARGRLRILARKD